MPLPVPTVCSRRFSRNETQCAWLPCGSLRTYPRNFSPERAGQSESHCGYFKCGDVAASFVRFGKKEAAAVERAVAAAVRLGVRTADMAHNGDQAVGTIGMADVILEQLEQGGI